MPSALSKSRSSKSSKPAKKLGYKLPRSRVGPDSKSEAWSALKEILFRKELEVDGLNWNTPQEAMFRILNVAAKAEKDGIEDPLVLEAVFEYIIKRVRYCVAPLSYTAKKVRCDALEQELDYDVLLRTAAGELNEDHLDAMVRTGSIEEDDEEKHEFADDEQEIAERKTIVQRARSPKKGERVGVVARSPRHNKQVPAPVQAPAGQAPVEYEDYDDGEEENDDDEAKQQRMFAAFREFMAMQRKPGRQRKHPNELVAKPKRGRGRPPKQPIEDQFQQLNLAPPFADPVVPNNSFNPAPMAM